MTKVFKNIMLCYINTMGEDKPCLIFDLHIPYSEKDEVKKLGYKLMFNPGTKRWVYKGTELPRSLKPYRAMYISIPYSKREKYKEKFSIQWNSERKEWLCKYKDFWQMKELHDKYTDPQTDDEEEEEEGKEKVIDCACAWDEHTYECREKQKSLTETP